ncbi:MAG: spondin domain-containing protein [Gammaproteobacteria bacterium]|nr:spondin domain-containing protein [Gammaproteobacteria bacterium]
MKKTLTVLAVSSALLTSSAFADGLWKTYHVKITNITAHQVITPPTVVAHNGKYHMFNITRPASAELAIMAETGNPGPLAMAASENDNVYSVEIGKDNAGEPTVIPPGHSLVVEIEAPSSAFFTVAGMLASSNDAFMGAANIKAPRDNKKSRRHAMTYDAGTEMNNEDCAYVPGPPCSEESGNARAEFDSATGERISEGFVSIHNGIHGHGDLMPKYYDWRGPTAYITIE